MKWPIGDTSNANPQLLTDEGQTYFGQVLVEYQLLPPPSSPGAPAEQAIRATADSLATKATKDRTWADLFKLEECVLKLQPDETIKRRAWALRAKYKTIASDKEYDAYLASSPPD